MKRISKCSKITFTNVYAGHHKLEHIIEEQQ